MKKTYTYDNKIYVRKIKFTGAFAAIFGLYSLVRFVMDFPNYLMLTAIVVCAYTFWETYISVSNPQTVEVDDESITFSGCGKSHTYLWSEITVFKCKEFISAKKIFLRVNNASILKGRYWLHCLYFNDTDELYNLILNKELEIHPDSLKAKAKRSNEESFEKRKAERLAKLEEERKNDEEKARLKAEKKAARKASKGQ